MDLDKIENSPLSAEEKEILTQYVQNVLSTDPRLTMAPSLSAKCFGMFLEGYSASDIQKTNPQFPLGMILHAQVKYQWDKQRDEYTMQLYQRIRDKVLNTQLSSVEFISDLLSATNKRNGKKLKRYFQTGDEADLPDIEIKSLLTYNKAVEVLARLTGQDNKKTLPDLGGPQPGSPPVGIGGDTVDRQPKSLPPANKARVIIRKALKNKKEEG